jgi:hypothetical protein
MVGYARYQVLVPVQVRVRVRVTGGFEPVRYLVGHGVGYSPTVTVGCTVR